MRYRRIHFGVCIAETIAATQLEVDVKLQWTKLASLSPCLRAVNSRSNVSWCDVA